MGAEDLELRLNACLVFMGIILATLVEAGLTTPERLEQKLSALSTLDGVMTFFSEITPPQLEEDLLRYISESWEENTGHAAGNC